MSNPKLSLIIAVYNIRQYVGECIESCINQDDVSADDYEIIIVNDGSTDDSAYIVERKIKGVPNARMLTKVNGGLSDARNYGLKNAMGEYIWYIDGDDIIATNAVRVILDAIQLQAQVFLIDYFELISGNNIIKRSFSEKRLPGGIFNGCHMIEREEIPFPPMMAWLQIQKKDFIVDNGLHFLLGIKSEDLEYTSKLFAVATKVCHIKNNLYYYRLNREDSIMNKRENDIKWIENLLRIYKSVDEYTFSVRASENYRSRVLSVIGTHVIYSLYSQSYYCYKMSNEIIKNSKIDIYNVLLSQKNMKGLAIFLISKYTPFFISHMILGRHEK